MQVELSAAEPTMVASICDNPALIQLRHREEEKQRAAAAAEAEAAAAAAGPKRRLTKAEQAKQDRDERSSDHIFLTYFRRQVMPA